MKKFEVKTRFIFEGVFWVNAENIEDAHKNIEEQCGLVMGGKIHTTLSNKDIDWEFDTHPEIKIIKIKQTKNHNNK